MTNQNTTNTESKGINSGLFDPQDAVILLLDHQAGLFQTVKDISVAELRTNTTALAKIATLLKIPVITSASEPDGPNGPLMAEIQEAAPHAVFVPRKGEINALENELFVKTVRETGKKTLIIAGVWTSVCVAFPALTAVAAGYRVYTVMDASGDPSEFASRITIARLAQAGVIPISTNAVLSEFQRHWGRENDEEWAAVYAEVAPNYGAVIESYQKAQEAAKKRQAPAVKISESHLPVKVDKREESGGRISARAKYIWSFALTADDESENKQNQNRAAQ